MRRKYHDISFTQDGNHPSLAGSYLYALLLYADLSGHDVGNVTYAPTGVSGQLAGMLKNSVSNFLACTANQLRSCSFEGVLLGDDPVIMPRFRRTNRTQYASAAQ